MKQLRWTMITLSFASIIFVVWRAPWITNLTAPGMSLGVVHRDSAPLWSPPRDKLSDLLAGLDPSDEWHRLDAKDVSMRIEARWGAMLLELLLLLIPATLFPGWIYTRVRGRMSDALLHTGVRTGTGLASGFILSFLLWILLGGWGPPLVLPLSVLGGVLGFVTGVVSHGRLAAQLDAGTDGAARRSSAS